MTRFGPLLLALSISTVQMAEGQVPSAGDFAACNEEASQAVKERSAAPTTNDHIRAASARSDANATSPTEPATTPIESPDPQIHGMDARGAQSPEYQAAYRSCMRRKGF